jgi:hypothetical protein
MDDVPYRPDARQTKHHSSRPSTVSWSFCSSLHLFRRLSSLSGRHPVIDQLQIFFPSSNKGRLMQLNRRAKNQNSNKTVRTSVSWSEGAFNRYWNCVFNFNSPDAYLWWSGRELNRYGNACWRSTVRMTIPLGPDARSLIWKLLATDMRLSGRHSHTVQMQLSNRKDFQRKSQKLCRIVVRPDGGPESSVLITTIAHLNPQPINRGPWALRTARIRYWIPLKLRELFCEVIGADLFSLKPLQVCCCCAITEVYLRSRP